MPGVTKLFGGSIGKIFDGIGGFIGSAISAAKQSFEGLASGDINKFINAQSQIGLQLGELFLDETPLIPSSIKDAMASLIALGQQVDVLKFISNPAGEARRIVSGMGKTFAPALKKMITKPANAPFTPMQAGGELIARGTKDSIPALLAPNEVTIDRSTTSLLKTFLENNTGSNANFSNDERITEIIDILRTPQRVETSIKLNERTFAEIILDLNRNNARLSV
jgi:hypothetical protein